MSECPDCNVQKVIDDLGKKVEGLYKDLITEKELRSETLDSLFMICEKFNICTCAYCGETFQNRHICPEGKHGNIDIKDFENESTH